LPISFASRAFGGRLASLGQRCGCGIGRDLLLLRQCRCTLYAGLPGLSQRGVGVDLVVRELSSLGHGGGAGRERRCEDLRLGRGGVSGGTDSCNGGERHGGNERPAQRTGEDSRCC
jgi:hypothetical protein